MRRIYLAGRSSNSSGDWFVAISINRRSQS
jgi:hypothetical protein